MGTVEPPLAVAASEIAEVLWPEAAQALQLLEEGFTFDFSLQIHAEVKHGTKKVR